MHGSSACRGARSTPARVVAGGSGLREPRTRPERPVAAGRPPAAFYDPSMPDRRTPDPDPGPGRRSRWLRPIAVPAGVAGAVGVLVIVLAVTAGALWMADGENRDRAERWKAQSDALRALVDERTRALNRQTRRLNTAATRLRDARAAIVRSEEDVDDLVARQRQLADEKARVEDDRAALVGEQRRLVERRRDLEEVSEALLACNAELSEVVVTSLQGGSPPDDLLQDTADTCGAADDAASAYLALHGER